MGTGYRCKGRPRVTVGLAIAVQPQTLTPKRSLPAWASTDLHVYDIGICPSPLLYFSLFHLDVDGGIEITASHNPSEVQRLSRSVSAKTRLYGEQIQDIRVKMRTQRVSGKAGRQNGALCNHFHPITSIC